MSHADKPTATSTSLILRIRTNDSSGWERFVDLYGPLVWSWCRASKLQPNDADDVSQEVLVSVALAIKRYEHTGSFRSWLWKITSNKIRDHFRKKNRGQDAIGGEDFGNWINQVSDDLPAYKAVEDSAVKQVGEDPSQATASPSVDDDLLARALELIRAEFEESTWSAFVGMYFEKRTAKEVAIDMGWATPDGADAALGAKRVRQAKFRVLKRLRDEFGEVLNL